MTTENTDPTCPVTCPAGNDDTRDTCPPDTGPGPHLDISPNTVLHLSRISEEYLCSPQVKKVHYKGWGNELSHRAVTNYCIFTGG